MNQPGVDRPRVSRVLVERYVAKLRKRRRWRRLAVTVSVFVLLLTASLYYLGWHTRVLDIRKTTVKGTKVLTITQIEAAAKVPLHQPLAAVDTMAIKLRVQAIPRVARATIERDWPHTIVIDIVERVPAAALPDPQGTFTIVDANGVAFATAPTAAAADVPVISYQPATPPAARAQVITGALAALKALPAALRARVSGISATGPYAITLDLTPSSPKGSPVTVNWGGADQPDLKARVLTVLLTQGATHYDVSAPDAPAFSGS